MNVKDYRLTKAVIDQLEPGMLLHNSSGRSFRQVIMIDHDRHEVVVRIERGEKGSSGQVSALPFDAVEQHGEIALPR